MPRQRSLPEILADDTGRIRPEVADLLMEASAQPGFHPHQRHREILQEVPRESFSNMILFFLGLMIFSVLCLWAISYRLSLKATMEENQVSSPANPSEETPAQTIAKREAPPVSNQKKIENEVNEQPVKEQEIEKKRPKFIEPKTYFGPSGGCR